MLGPDELGFVLIGTSCYDITETLLKVALNTINQTNNTNIFVFHHYWGALTWFTEIYSP